MSKSTPPGLISPLKYFFPQASRVEFCPDKFWEEIREQTLIRGKCLLHRWGLMAENEFRKLNLATRAREKVSALLYIRQEFGLVSLERKSGL
ncbi:MAG TPA: hypothetical protein VL545_04940 [Rhodanobacter sp.]|nr:hypothetical protein [Rhodanobacter sp.]